MTTKTDMSLEEYIKLTTDYTESQYGGETPEPIDFIFKEAEVRKERMLSKKMTSGGYTDLTKSEVEKIENEIRTSNNIKVGKFSIKIKNYDKKKETVGMNIYEEKVYKTHFGSNPMPRKLSIPKDMRFEGCEWIKYFKNPILGGHQIPVAVAAEIVGYCQSLLVLEAFI